MDGASSIDTLPADGAIGQLDVAIDPSPRLCEPINVSLPPTILMDACLLANAALEKLTHRRHRHAD